MKSVPVVIALLTASLAANLLLWRRVSAFEARVAAATAPKSYPLGEMMGYMQRYADKLWFAGAAGNWDLAKFYHDEINETADDIAAAHVVDDGLEVSKLLAAQLPPAVDAVGRAVAAKDAAAFRQRYEAMVNTCNACHVEAKHAFIHVAVPAGPPAHWNQSFAP
ncbi:MAG TPA: hypothetical protein VHD61_05110 [Lacunisphaera sp.]|nr:hypothetical protein [Lacunisphaera sp.]